MKRYAAATRTHLAVRLGRSLLVGLALAVVLAPARFAEAADRFREGLLFRVSKAAVPPSFVFGTLHVADPRVLDLAPPVRDAFAGARAFAPELGTDTLVDPRLEDAELLAKGQTLAALLGEPAFGELAAQLAPQGVPPSTTLRLKPWAALLKVSRAAPASDAVTLDAMLLDMARARRMRIVSLEWVDEQIAAFDGIPMDTQLALLRHVLTHREALAAGAEATVAAWLRRDLAGLARMGEDVARRYPSVARDYRVLARHVIANRTVLMHHRLVLPLRDGRLFVAVGASHLPGENGLLRMRGQGGPGRMTA